MYNHKEIEKKWTEKWKNIDTKNSGGDKYYCLCMFPYPSGGGLHLGHARAYIPSDIYARTKKMLGFDVIYPIGWDSFGLPAEQYAIKNKLNPAVSTKQNIDRFKEQITRLGLSFDWDREFSTTDKDFYKWTQWIFIQLYKKGLVYSANAPINWCPDCKTGLANEDLEAGACERCGTQIERRIIRQWVLKITEYADRLLDDIDTLTEWPEFIKIIQRDWIGKREGYEIVFKTTVDLDIEIFTTRPDTLYGGTFIAISPESEYIDVLLKSASNKKEIEEYRNVSFSKRPDEKIKSGVLIDGVNAINPITNKEIPIYVADYVLGGYGTGAVFGAPAHDERDNEFAVNYGIEIIDVVDEDGKLINSGDFNGMDSEEAKDALSKKTGGVKKFSYKLRDWDFARQKYWGEPFPIVFSKDRTPYLVDEKELPVVLPEVESYKQTDTGESPLVNIKDWVEVKGFINKEGYFESSEDGEIFYRETNTMPQWAGSSWYYLRFIDPKNDKELISKDLEKKYMPVDLYTGGAEHAARHLIYARFWHKFLYDEGIVSTKEPFKRLESVGVLTGEDGKKLSKRTGAQDPVEVADQIGADALRIYLAHIAPFGQRVSWNSRAVAGPRRFLERVLQIKDNLVDTPPSADTLSTQYETVMNVEKDIEEYKFNTAVSKLMIFSNHLVGLGSVPKESYIAFLKILAPFAPFLTEEIWEGLGNKTSIHTESWPEYDVSKIVKSVVNVVVQVEGKTRGTIEVPTGLSQDEIIEKINADERITKYIKGKEVKVFLENKLISFI